MNLTAYLAGPEVFVPYAFHIGETKKAICTEFGFTGLFPFDNDVNFETSPNPSKEIFRNNVALLRKADFIIANLTPWRGISADPGTVWEVGCAYGMGKPIWAYTYDTSTLLIRTIAEIPSTERNTRGRILDRDGYHIENFNLFDNLMIPYSLTGPAVQIAPIQPDPITSMEGFRECLRMAHSYLSNHHFRFNR